MKLIPSCSKTVKTLKELFPKASAAFIKANAHVLTAIAPDIVAADKQNAPTVNVERKPSTRRKMNATEHGFSILLEAQRRAGDIEDYKFESVKLRISDRCFYTPDFIVERLHQRPLIIEIKGPFIREDALIKFKAAKELHHWADFEMHQRSKDGWLQIM